MRRPMAVDISRPTDATEIEAETLSRKIVRGESVRPVQVPRATVQRKCKTCGDICACDQRKPNEATFRVRELIRDRGKPLPGNVRDRFESQLGADLKGVRLHTGARAGEGAASLGAKAFTIGSDVVFGDGAFTLETIKGLQLLAHELVHVVQNARASESIIQRDVDPTLPDPMEARDAGAEYQSRAAALLAEVDDVDPGLERSKRERRWLIYTHLTQARTWDEVTAAEEAITHDSEDDVIKRLGPEIVDFAPTAFPATWAKRLDDRFQLPHSIGFVRDAAASDLNALQKVTADFPSTLYPVGLPVEFAEALDLHSYAVLREHALLSVSHPVRDTALAGNRFLFSKYRFDLEVHWVEMARRFIESVRDGTASITADSFKAFNMYIQSLDDPEHAVQSPVPLDALNERPADLQKVDVAIAKMASWLAFGSWFVGWPIVGAAFRDGLAATDARIAAQSGYARLALGNSWADRWGYADEAWKLIGKAVKDQLPGMAKEAATFMALQFVPGVDVVLDIYFLASSIADLGSALADSAGAEYDVMASKTVIDLQRNSAEKVFKDRANALRVGGDLLAIKASLKALKAKFAKAHVEVPGPAGKKVPIEAPKVDPQFARWKSRLNAETRALLDRNPRLAALYEQADPLVREILSYCASLCIPESITPKELAWLERLLKSGKVRRSTKGLSKYLHDNASDLEAALSAIDRAEAPEALRALLEEGKMPKPKTLTPGKPEHKAQRWLDYQRDRPKRFKKPTSAMDAAWSKAYDRVIANKRAGGAFEQASLGELGFAKNSLLMIDDASGTGFIPDAVRGPRGGQVTELVWGKPYRFVEVKGWADMSMTGNLAAMLDYVDKTPGSFITVVFRSAKKPPPTRLSGPLNDALEQLIKKGRAEIVRLP